MSLWTERNGVYLMSAKRKSTAMVQGGSVSQAQWNSPVLQPHPKQRRTGGPARSALADPTPMHLFQQLHEHHNRRACSCHMSSIVARSARSGLADPTSMQSLQRLHEHHNRRACSRHMSSIVARSALQDLAMLTPPKCSRCCNS